MYYLYILLCADNIFYVGFTNDLKRRLSNHNSGHGSKFVSARLPVKLVYYEIYPTKKEAVKREKQIKNWSRIKKINLIKLNKKC